MRRLRLTLTAIFLLLAAPLRAQETTLLTALDLMPADAAWWGESRIVDLVDIAALRQSVGLRDGLGLADINTAEGEDQERLTQLLWRFYGSVSFREYLVISAEEWPTRLGFDVLDLSWTAEIGAPPRRLLYLAGDAVPQGDALKVLEGFGLAPVEHGGTTVWSKGENDYGMDMQHREPAFPFWGWLGSSARLHRGEVALVGARAWPDLDLAFAVERGAAESLADLPRFRLAAEAVAQAEYSAGPVLQVTLVDEAFGQGAIGNAPSADGLPPFELFAFADREDASGHQLVLVLTYGTDAETAAVAAAALAAKLETHKGNGGKTLAERFPGLTIEGTQLETDNGAAAVVRLAMPPLPVRVDGKVANRSLLYAHFLRMLYSRDLGFLATKG